MELLSAQSSASSHGGKCSLQTRRRSSTYRLSCVRELISITRVYTRSTRDHRPMLGDYASSCGSWSLYSATGNIPMALSEAIIATYMTIHMARSPGSHSERIASPAGSSRRERKSCGCGFQATKARNGRNLPLCSHAAPRSARCSNDAAPLSRSVGSQDRVVARVRRGGHVRPRLAVFRPRYHSCHCRGRRCGRCRGNHQIVPLFRARTALGSAVAALIDNGALDARDGVEHAIAAGLPYTPYAHSHASRRIEAHPAPSLLHPSRLLVFLDGGPDLGGDCRAVFLDVCPFRVPLDQHRSVRRTPPPTLCRRTTVLQPIVRLCASAARLVER